MKKILRDLQNIIEASVFPWACFSLPEYATYPHPDEGRADQYPKCGGLPIYNFEPSGPRSFTTRIPLYSRCVKNMTYFSAQLSGKQQVLV